MSICFNKYDITGPSDDEYDSSGSDIDTDLIEGIPQTSTSGQPRIQQNICHQGL